MCIDPSTHCWECDSCFQDYPEEMALLGQCFECWEEEQMREQREETEENEEENRSAGG
jgi:predicted ATP-dependent serine protease